MSISRETLTHILEAAERAAAPFVKAGGLRIEYRFDEPMSAHTTFKVGGPADLLVRPVIDGGAGAASASGISAGGLDGAAGGPSAAEAFAAYAGALFGEARRENVPVFVLGGGANLVVADAGIRGIVLDTSGYMGLLDGAAAADAAQGAGSAAAGGICGAGARDGQCGASTMAAGLRFAAGTSVDDAVEAAAEKGLSGLEFLAGMPGTIGGAVWMNARCYDREVADALTAVDYLDLSGASDKQPELRTYTMNAADFAYKKSPFQDMDALILSGTFQINVSPRESIREAMENHRRDRREKGHFKYPSAGSAFKNNREFGKPTGRIIDELGLKGASIGGAQIAPWHGNIIINKGGASAADIKALTELVRKSAFEKLGINLECEILFAGSWNGA